MNKQRASTAPIVSIAIGVVFSITVLAVTICSPATIPLWCTAHGGCP
jgi:hypothetical protein